MIKTLLLKKRSISIHFPSLDSEHMSNEMLKPINVVDTSRRRRTISQENPSRYHRTHFGMGMRTAVTRITEDAAREKVYKSMVGTYERGGQAMENPVGG